MKMTIALLALCAMPVVAGAQTSDQMLSDINYAEGWSQTLGAALFNDAGMTELRTADELTAQWSTVSEEDRSALRTACMKYQSTTEGAAAAAGTDSGAASAEGTATESAGTSETATAETGTTTAESDTTAAVPMTVNAEQMAVICPAVEGL
jgi:hypothetical protein